MGHQKESVLSLPWVDSRLQMAWAETNQMVLVRWPTTVDRREKRKFSHPFFLLAKTHRKELALSWPLADIRLQMASAH
jgi:hypothetical protein